MKNNVALALSGGAARGFAHIPVCEAFDNCGVKPVRIAGTSMGAVIGALYASGMSGKDIREQTIAMFAKRTEVMSRLMQAQRGGGLIALSFTKSGTLDPKVLLEAFLPDDLPPRIEDLAIPFTAVAVDFLSGEEVHFSSGPLITALAASIAVPAIIKPVELDGRILIDGGAANPMPHDVAGAHGDPVIASDVIGLRSPKSGGLPTPAESVYGAAVILMQSVMKAKAALLPPALLVAPGIDGFTLFDFFKAGDVIAAGNDAGRQVEAFLRKG
ncbi:MAG: patatin-like phospholipase family protein [Rhodobiaceae bacterium]|nr:patatin-like phospholipase family protein [Rhodobiaceae bacterium]MCC0049004.1 patatin-like phospholipase family protein [Rhodobiaceae bacterium]